MIVYYLWIIVYNKLLWISAKSVFVAMASTYRAVRVFIFLLPGIEYERAKTRSVRILGSISFSPFRCFVPPCLFCTLPLAFYESSIRFHPISLFALPSPRRQPLCPWCRSAGYRNVFNRILSTRVCQSEREAPERRRLLWLKKITADNYRGWVRGQSWLKEGMWQPHSAHTSLTTAKFRRLSRRAAAASSGTVLKEQGYWTPAV